MRRQLEGISFRRIEYERVVSSEPIIASISSFLKLADALKHQTSQETMQRHTLRMRSNIAKARQKRSTVPRSDIKLERVYINQPTCQEGPLSQSLFHHILCVRVRTLDTQIKCAALAPLPFSPPQHHYALGATRVGGVTL